MILAPTRELAIQIDKDFRNFGRDTGLTSALIYGGVDYDKQRDSLRAGCDIIIATPGRLIDYLKQHVFSFRGIEALVIDEADRMFDLGFIKDIRFLLRRMPPREQRQGMLFSATLSHRVLELAYEHMNSPEKLTAETETVTASHVRQAVYFPAKEEKLPLLIGLLSRIDAQRSIVFVNTKIAAEKVTRTLEQQGFTVATLSGDVPQAKRERLLGKFQKRRDRSARRDRRRRARPAYPGRLARLQLRPAARRRRLRAPHRPHRAPRRRGRRDQLRLRSLRDGPAGHRGVHRPEDSGRAHRARAARRAAAPRPARRRQRAIDDDSRRRRAQHGRRAAQGGQAIGTPSATQRRPRQWRSRTQPSRKAGGSAKATRAEPAAPRGRRTARRGRRILPRAPMRRRPRFRLRRASAAAAVVAVDRVAKAAKSPRQAANGNESSGKHAERARASASRAANVPRTAKSPTRRTSPHRVEPHRVQRSKPGLFQRIARFFNPR